MRRRHPNCRLGAGDLGIGAGQLRAQFARIHHHQHITCSHQIALTHRDFRYPTGQPR